MRSSPGCHIVCMAIAITSCFVDSIGARTTSCGGAAFLVVPLDVESVASAHDDARGFTVRSEGKRKGRHPTLASLRASSADPSLSDGRDAFLSEIQTPQKGAENGVPRKNDRTKTPRAVAISALVATDQGDKAPPQFRPRSSVNKLKTHPGYLSMENVRDRSLTRYLVSLVERRQGQIDKILSIYGNQWPPKKNRHAPLLVACLRVAVAEILFKKTPSYAATKETISILRAYGKRIPEPLVKFANAILRRVATTGQELLENETSVLDNVAPWLLEEWKQTYGEERTWGIVNHFMKEPPYELSINHAAFVGLTPEQKETEIELLCEEMGGNVVILPQGSLHLTKQQKGSPSFWPQYHRGTWWVQSASSTLPALALTSAIQRMVAAKAAGLSEQEVYQHTFDDHEIANVDLSHHHVVDMCASPGGKTCQLLSLGFGHVTAVESGTGRVGKLIENLLRLKLRDRCSVVIADGQSWTPGSPPIDSVQDFEQDGIDWVREDILEKNPQDVTTNISGILLDVPCSSTGVGGRHPDVLRRPQDLGNLLSTQQELLTHCADNLLQPGGILVYSTCSLLRNESEDQVLKLLSRNQKDGEGPPPTEKQATMKILPIGPDEVPGFEKAIDEHGFLRVVPATLDGPLHSSDGFFVARLLRVA